MIDSNSIDAGFLNANPFVFKMMIAPLFVLTW